MLQIDVQNVTLVVDMIALSLDIILIGTPA
jgi:hypothetical protein